MNNLSVLEKLAFWVSLATNLTNKKQHQILQEIEFYEDVFSHPPNFLSRLMELVDQNSYKTMVLTLDEDLLDNYIRNLTCQDIELVTYFSDLYPFLLKEISSPPIVLYCKGNISLLNKKCVSIVGTRRITKYGSEVTKKITSMLSNSGLVIVSGLADGVDSVAHKTCVEQDRSTIAVLGGGINLIYPPNNTELANKILKEGLLISEYPPNEKPQTYYFPMRNRIIAGLSRATIITESPLKSGALITKDYAIESNRDVFSVPGRFGDIFSAGCNQIIKDCQATLLTSVNDVLKVYNIMPNVVNVDKSYVQLSINEELIYKLLDKEGDLHYEDILKKTGLETKTLNTMLMKLEIRGLVSKIPGNFYSLIRR